MARVVRTLVAGAVAACFVSLGSAAAQAPNSHIGTWRVNVAKSKYDPGPAPQSQTVKYEASVGGLKLTSDGVDGKGAKTHAEYTAKFDGKPYAFSGNANADMITLKQVDARTLESSWTLRGKPTITTRSTVSADGKSRSATQTGTNAAGQKVNHTIVYERQM